MKKLNIHITLLCISISLIPLKSFSQLPIADFTSSSQNGCAPHVVNFIDASTGNPNSYLWDFGDPNSPGTSNLSAPSHMYQAPGIYTVTLTVSNSSGTNSITKTGFVSAYQSPIASYIVSDDTICSGQSITFTDASAVGDTLITTYQWTFNDGSGPMFSNPVNHAFLNFGSNISYFYPTYLVTDANGCSSYFSSDTIFVYPQPSVSLSILSTSSLILPLDVGFSASATGTNVYLWNFGDPSSGASNTSSLVAPFHQYANAGTYTVQVTAGTTGCEATDTVTFDVNTLLKIQPTGADFDAGIYPNPASDFLNVDLKFPVNSPASYKIYSYNGQSVKSGQINVKADKFKIDLTELKSGNFILEIADEKVIYRKTFTHN